MHGQCHDDESKDDGRGDNIAQYFDALHPDGIVPSYSMESTPEAVCQMEPQCHESCNVYNNNPNLRKYPASIALS